MRVWTTYAALPTYILVAVNLRLGFATPKNISTLASAVVDGTLTRSDALFKKVGRRPYMYTRNEDLRMLSQKISKNRLLFKLPPSPKDNGPVSIQCGIDLETIHKLDEVNMVMTATIILNLHWKDHRLANINRSEPLGLPKVIEQLVWKPDITVQASKKHTNTIDNKALRIGRNGEVVLSVKMTTAVVCLLELSNFPLDRQVCTLVLYSFQYYSSELLLYWDEHSHTVAKHASDTLASFKHEHNHASIENRTFCQSYADSDQGEICRDKNFLTVGFEFRRYFFSVFFISYLPAMAMVFIAGLATFMDPNSAPARVGMSVTTVLTISTVIQGLKSTLPAVSYLTALDIFLWVSFFFVAATLVEFAYLNYVTVVIPRFRDEITNPEGKIEIENALTYALLAKNVMSRLDSAKHKSRRATLSFFKRKESKCKSPISVGTETTDDELSEPNDPAQTLDLIKEMTPRCSRRRSPKWGSQSVPEQGQCQIALRIDRKFRYGYTVSFIWFNAVYWIYFVYISQHD